MSYMGLLLYWLYRLIISDPSKKNRGSLLRIGSDPEGLSGLTCLSVLIKTVNTVSILIRYRRCSTVLYRYKCIILVATST